MTNREVPEVCPVCGEGIPRNALACPECGADYDSGWREDADTYDGVDLPDADFNYDEFVKQEFRSSLKPDTAKIIWWITALVILAALIALYFYAAH